jgi:hypothetical protein
MSKIQISASPYNLTAYYDGKYTCDCSQWEDEYQEDTYEFTLVFDTATSTVVEIVWQDRTPKNAEEIQSRITREFYTKNNKAE